MNKIRNILLGSFAMVAAATMASAPATAQQQKPNILVIMRTAQINNTGP